MSFLTPNGVRCHFARLKHYPGQIVSTTTSIVYETTAPSWEGDHGARRISQRIFLLSLYCIYYHRMVRRESRVRARARTEHIRRRPCGGETRSRQTGIIILRATKIRVGNRVAAVVRTSNARVYRDEGDKKPSGKKTTRSKTNGRTTDGIS